MACGGRCGAGCGVGVVGCVWRVLSVSACVECECCVLSVSVSACAECECISVC